MNELSSNENKQRIPTSYTKMAEWEVGKDITPLGWKKVKGETMKKDPKFCNPDGDVWVLSYVDHGNEDIERSFDTPYDSLDFAIKREKVEKGKKYNLVYGPGPEGYKKWQWRKL